MLLGIEREGSTTIEDSCDVRIVRLFRRLRASRIGCEDAGRLVARLWVADTTILHLGEEDTSLAPRIAAASVRLNIDKSLTELNCGDRSELRLTARL